MHVPDGYIGPKTVAITYTVMIPVWYYALKQVKSRLSTRTVPCLAMTAAFSFVIMMLNIPIPGGASGHATGGVIIALAIGVWEAVISLSVVLLLQALLFGDGGITSFAANCFNLAFLMPVSGYAAYKILSIKKTGSFLPASLAGYAGINIAGLSTAFILGIQTILETDAAGTPLYAPFPLSVTIPAICIPHATVFGLAEGLMTGLVLQYLRKIIFEDNSVNNISGVKIEAD